jgi:hypothetical protein
MVDETITNFDVPSFIYAGQPYTRLGVASNGYVIVGGADDPADISAVNQSFPDPARPNNVLAPFWTDLDPSAGGTVRIDLAVTSGLNTYIVVDWDAVPEKGPGPGPAPTDQFEVWIGANGVQDIWFAYGALTGSGSAGHVTVGAENGCQGSNYYYNGVVGTVVGTQPANWTDLVVTSP